MKDPHFWVWSHPSPGSHSKGNTSAILQGLPEAFGPAFRLRGAGRDEPDAELARDAPEVGGVLRAAQLLLEGSVPVIADKDIEPIAV